MSDFTGEIDFFVKNDNEYLIVSEGFADKLPINVDREGLKHFRNHIHNLLISLNMELNYE